MCDIMIGDRAQNGGDCDLYKRPFCVCAWHITCSRKCTEEIVMVHMIFVCIKMAKLNLNVNQKCGNYVYRCL